MNMVITTTINSSTVVLISGLEVTFNWCYNEGEQATTVHFGANTSNAKGEQISFNGQVSNNNLSYNVSGGTVNAAIIEAINTTALELLSGAITTQE